ncbi:hypothetical protein SDC9_164265 [bioreactor metagenome]|uniref:Uncharacterized protein n=1 Tax=bioreactor metagenome TaxID=1076179 RepID=A0A645FR66_9ZZZZ
MLVDALVVGQLATQLDDGVHLFAAHGVHGQHDQAVVEQQHVTGAHVARQFLIVQPHAVDVAQLGARGVQHERRALRQHHLAIGKLAHADLRALQVGHDGHLAPRTLGGRAHRGRAVDVVLRRAVAEVQPHHVQACSNHLLKQLRIAGSGAQSGNDLGGAADLHEHLSLIGCVIEFQFLHKTSYKQGTHYTHWG